MSSEMLTQIRRPLKLRTRQMQNPVILRTSDTAITADVTTTTDPIGSVIFDTSAGVLFMSDGSKWQAVASAAQAVATSSTPTFASETLTAAAGLTLGVDSTTASKVKLFNATSGSISVAPPTGALGTVTLTLPAATDTLVGKATTDTFTNKTLTAPIWTQNVIARTTAVALVAADSGSLVTLNAVGGFDTRLPVPAAGLKFTFVVKVVCTGSDVYTITTNGTTQNIIHGSTTNAAGTAGDHTAGTAVDVITFANGQMEIGDRVEIVCDGTLWYATAHSNSATAITFD